MLRRKGYSVREISDNLGASKSSISLWVRNVPLSKHARKILERKYTKGQLASQRVHRATTEEKLNKARMWAKLVVRNSKMSSDVERIVCAMLYWCEGAKSKNDTSFIFANSDPDLVFMFLSLLRKNFDINESKFRVLVHLHDYHSESRQLQFWAKVTKIPLSQFIKPYRKGNTGKRTRKNYQGCISLRYHDVRIARQVQAVAREFIRK